MDHSASDTETDDYEQPLLHRKEENAEKGEKFPGYSYSSKQKKLHIASWLAVFTTTLMSSFETLTLCCFSEIITLPIYSQLLGTCGYRFMLCNVIKLCFELLMAISQHTRCL